MPSSTEPAASPALTRVMAWVVLILMAGATAYTAWIVIANFNRIGV